MIMEFQFNVPGAGAESFAQSQCEAYKMIREPEIAEDRNYDLIVIGGGIYGVMIAFEAARRGLHALLLERDDFGGATSLNSLRILHGGLRYLQTLDVKRFLESVAERQWFLQTFPGLTEILPCIMPLYGKGTRRSSVLRFALHVNDLLSYSRNDGVNADRQIPKAKVVGFGQTSAIFPEVDRRELQAGAIWYDAFMPDSQRLLINLLRWSCAHGTTALNYMEAKELVLRNGRIQGVKAADRESNMRYKYRANIVVNAAGPWCRELAARLDSDKPLLFRSSIGWNTLLKREAVSDHAVGVRAKKRGAQTYFLVPWNGMLLAGTGQVFWSKPLERPVVSQEMLSGFIADLNEAVPALKLTKGDVLHVFSGFLPAKKSATCEPANREVIVNHGQEGGPRGLYSVSGVKFTTARLVAEKALNRIFDAKRCHRRNGKQTAKEKQHLGFMNRNPSAGFHESLMPRDRLLELMEAESVQHLDDLVFRRLAPWAKSKKPLQLAAEICDILGWGEGRRRDEMDRLHKTLEDKRPEKPFFRLDKREMEVG
jgi:glycerol-3-phosphate dehydrogenase